MEKNSDPQLSIKWLDFETYKNEIRKLRKEVFVEEQSLEEFMMDAKKDPLGLHLGLLDGDELVSIISLFVYKNTDPFLQSIGLKSEKPYVIQYSRRAEKPEFRSKRIASLMVAHAVKSVVELFQPDLMFATLLGVHMKLRDSYIKLYGFNRFFDTEDENGPLVVMVMDDLETIKNIVLKLRNDSIKLSSLHQLDLPNLAHHILISPQLNQEYQIHEDENNIYLQHISLKDELPRLSAQARMLYVTQQAHWTRLMQENPGLTSVLDLGCGPGVYLSLLSKIKELSQVQFTGIDYSDDLITYARFAHSKLNWYTGSVYNLQFENESFDLVHASFLFIHLLKPFLAIREAYRVLKPGGLMYITDVNDDTFQGPQEIVDMVNSHDDMYEGNRRIMRDLDYLATQGGFELLHAHKVVANNTGYDGDLSFENGEMKLGKNTMWAMFSFMGQRDEIKDKFNKAQDVYFSNKDTVISIETHTRVYKKL